MDSLTRLAVRAQAGDKRALGSFVEMSYEQVWRLCSSLVDTRSAEDLTQETYLRVSKAIHNFRFEASAKTWLLSIARYVCMDELRSRVRHRTRLASLEASHSAQEATVADASQDPVVTDLLSRLDPDRRLVFVLTQVLGLTYDEAAQICGCPSGTIRSRLARARADLLEQIADEQSLSLSHRPPKAR